MAEFPMMPLWTDAYLGDTTHLTTLEHGAYLLLLMAMWRHDQCQLPNDDKRLARYTRLTPSQWKRIKSVVMEFFIIENDVLFQKKLQRERSFVKSKRKSQSLAGVASALKRKEIGSTDVGTNAQRTSNPHTHTHIKKDKDKSLSKENLQKNKPPDEFEKFWLIFPKLRRGNKQKAQAAWVRAVRRSSEKEIYNGCLEYSKSAEGNGKYAKGCEPWLNDERWEVDYSQRNESTSNDGGVCITSTIREIQRKIKMDERLQPPVENKVFNENTTLRYSEGFVEF